MSAEKLDWKMVPTDLKLWEVTYTLCGYWSATRIPSGVVYTQWRSMSATEWEPFFSVLG